ncbi:tyrosine-type recombinase/integrase [Erwinia amylovora]|uniref:tyrosine-type recombinase/integrase n=1 Tax=Erwinia amylovora TaxID=552 RepID=UPI003CFDB590
MSKKNNLPKGVIADYDRYGNVRLYFRAKGRKKVRLNEKPGTDAFEEEVSFARLGLAYGSKPEETAKDKPTAENSFQWLKEQYCKRVVGRVNPTLLGRRRRIFDEICNSIAPTGHRRGDLEFKWMERKHVMELRDTLRTTPGAQNELVKSLSAMFGWAVEAGIAKVNPASKIKDLHSGDGFHTWTIDEVRQYEARHPEGTKARLMLHLAMFTGLRLADLAIVGREHVKDGWLVIRPGKTGKSSKVTVEVPILPELRDTIAKSPCGETVFLVSDWNAPFSVNSLGNKMRDWCDQAGLPQCSTHGLRKAGATIAAENGATDDELMAIFGWTTKQQTTLYTKNASRKKLAGKAMHKLVPEPQKGAKKSNSKTRQKKLDKNHQKDSKNNG